MPSWGGPLASLTTTTGTGTQSFVHNFMTRSVAPYIGFTTIAIHEYGHHFGLSHPHDGFDYEEGIDYGLKIIGDESGTAVRDAGEGRTHSSHRHGPVPGAVDPLDARPLFDDLKRLVPTVEKQRLPPGRRS